MDPVEAYIRQAATARGIDPDVAVQVAKSEGISYVGDQGSSFGPFQLHYGGIAPGGDAVSGLGDTFTAQTGLHASDPSTIPAQINFALDQAKQNGWGAWHAWKGDPYAGIPRGGQMATSEPPMTDAQAAQFLQSRTSANQVPVQSSMSDQQAAQFLEQREAASSSSQGGTATGPLRIDVATGQTWQPQGGKMLPPQYIPGSSIQATPEVKAAAANLPTGSGRLANFFESIPVVGPGTEAAVSTLAPQGVAAWQEAGREYAAANPGEANMESVGANILGTIPMAATAPGRLALGMAGPLGARVYGAAVGGGLINATDAWLKGQPAAPAALEGAGGGIAGVLAGEGARSLTGLISDYVWPRPGALQNVNRTGLNMLSSALEGETPASLAQAQQKLGAAGFTGELSQGLTDLTGGIADIPGPGKAIVREAYRLRSNDQGARLDTALNSALGNSVNLPQYQSMITENRAAAADPLYQQWRSMQVHPTPALQALVPRLDAAGAFNSAEELGAIRGKPFSKSYFVGGPNKTYPTTEGWDMAKQGLDRQIDAAFSTGDKKKAAALIELKKDLITEIGKTSAGQVWNQARSEFADRSELLDQIDRGRDTFIGSRSGMTADELAEELSTLSGPELQARLVGARHAAGLTMRGTVNGDTTLRNTMLSPENMDKLQLMIGKVQADRFIGTLQGEKAIGTKAIEVTGGSPTASKQARRDALQPQPLPQYNPSLAQPLSFVPPHILEAMRPSTILQGGREAAYANARAQLAPILTKPASQSGNVLSALLNEAQRRSAVSGAAAKGGNVLSGLINSTAAPAMRRKGISPSLNDLLTPHAQ